MSRSRKIFLAITLGHLILGLSTSTNANTNNFVIDSKSPRTVINFKVSYLGLCWVHGNFTAFNGSFQFDANNPENSSINIKIDTHSINSNHVGRDNYLKGSRFLNVSQYPDALFVSTKIENNTGNAAKIHGEFTMKGITKDIIIDAEKVSESNDSRDGYRVGFSGTTTLSMADFNLMNLGPVTGNIHIALEVEGIRK